MNHDQPSAPPSLKTEPGWDGVFTRAQVSGAYPNGTRVVKIAQDPSGDFNPLGATGTVLGSMRHPQHSDLLVYFVAWDTHPRRAVVVIDWKLARLEETRP